jgi:ABC-2 type transport system permease protein
MSALRVVFTRELGAYVVSPVAPIFIVIFLVLIGVMTFNVGSLYERGLADLDPFFNYLPWLSLFLVPALAMRLWSEERRTGTSELLLTLPLPLWSLVVGKFLASWCVALVALALTAPTWITVSVLGDPDHGVIVAGYLGAALLAGAFMAIGAAISAATRSQVVAFVVTLVVCLALTLAGFRPVAAFLEGRVAPVVVESLLELSALPRYRSITSGDVSLDDGLYFVALIGCALGVNAAFVNAGRAR